VRDEHLIADQSGTCTSEAQTSSGLITNLESADSIPALYQHFFEITQHLEFEHFVYLARVPVSLSRPYMFAINGYPPDWTVRYQQRNYFAVDPIFAHVEASLKPLMWNDIPMHNPAVRAFFKDARKHGVGHGVTIPIYGRGGELALFSVARKAELPTSVSERVEMVRNIQSYVPHIHEQVNAVALSKGPAEVLKPQLTNREVDCLRWAGDGKTTWEIGRILDISERTVFFHLAQASDKLGVNSRPQAVARAVSMGEMDSFLIGMDQLRILDVESPKGSALN